MSINIIRINKEEKKHILCVGQVQSGKTKWIIDTIKKSDIKIIFWLSGTNCALYRQSNDSWFKDLKNDDWIVFYENLPNNLSDAINDDNNFKYIFSILKNTNYLNKIIKYDFTKKPILLIDDECDFASTNIHSNDNRSINKLINKIFNNSNNKSIYYSITATPFATLLDKNNNICESKFIPPYDSEKYCGSQKFIDHKSYICYDIDKKNIDIKDHLEEYLTYSFMYFISSIYQCEYNNVSLKQYQFLINIDNVIENHSVIRKNIYSVIKKCFKYFKIELYIKYKDIFDSMGINISDKKNIEKLYSYITNINDKINEAIVVLDSNNNEIPTNTYVIIIGGLIVSRGMRFEGLLTCSCLNTPRCAIGYDTLMQRARWFGYRENTMPYIRIITNQKMYDEYLQANDINNYLIEKANDINSLLEFCDKYKLKPNKNKIKLSSLQ